jgi:cobalamin-dependent methionine synthase I
MWKLTEEFQLDPDQSTSAIIVHHPEAPVLFDE